MHFIGSWVVAESSLCAGKETVGHLSKAVYAGHDFIAPDLISRSFPFGHPVADQGQPVGANAGMCEILGRGKDQAHRVKISHSDIGRVGYFPHKVTATFVRGK